MAFTPLQPQSNFQNNQTLSGLQKPINLFDFLQPTQPVKTGNSVRDIVGANTQQKPMFSGGNIEQGTVGNDKLVDLGIFGTRKVPTKYVNERNLAPVGSTAYNIGTKLESAGNAFSNYMSQGASQAQEAIKPTLTNAQNYVGYKALGDKVKAKYPGAYDHLDSALVGKKTLEKYPEYSSYVDQQNQTPFSDHPLASTISYAGKNLIGGVNTVESGIKTYFDSLRAKDATTGFLQGTEGMINTGLGAFQTATNVLPQGQGAKVLVNPLVNTFFASNEAEKVLKPINEGIDTGIKYGQEAAGFDPNSQASQSFRNIGTTATNMALMYGGQKTLGLGYDKLTGKKAPVDPNSIDSMQEAPVKPYVDPNSIDSVPDVPVREYNQKTGVISAPIQKQNKAKAEAIGDKGVEEIYQAVNPTTRENKAVLRQRVNDLLPYIDETNMFNNDLPKVKERVDSDMNTAFRSMEDYEANVGVKGTVKTAQIIKALKEKYQEKIGDSYLNPDEAIAAQRVIDLLNGFGKTLKDSDIIKVRRAWDKIIKANKGFMQSADANIKGEVFNESNKFLRDEIRKSNPEYANYLDKAHKTITLSDVLEATIQRRTGQTQGGFLRQGLENVSRVVGTGIGGAIGGGAGALIGAGATEALITGTKKLTGSSAKLTRGKKLILKSGKNGTNDNNTSNSGNPSMVAKPKQLTKGPRLVEKPKKVTTPTNEQSVSNTQSSTNSNSDIPEGYTKNAFGEVIKKPSNSNGGFIRNPFAKPEPKRLFAGENSAQPPKGKTGWFKGADGKMRFEIDDSGAKFIDNAIVNKNGKALLGDIFRHDELFNQYPELKSIIVKFNDTVEKGGGSYNPSTRTLTINGLELDPRTGEFLGGTKEAKSTLLHEIQHSIQEKEGFARGGSANESSLKAAEKYWYNNDKTFKEIADTYNKINQDHIEGRITGAERMMKRMSLEQKFEKEIKDFTIGEYEAYKRLAGEVEARNVQARMGLTAKERTIKKPESTEDVPRAKQIIRMDSKGPSLLKIPEIGKKSEGIKVYKGIKKYGASSNDINIDARRGLDTEIGNLISEELKTLPSYEGRTIRTSNSIFGKDISEIKIGDIVSDKGFLSSSKNKSKIWGDYGDKEIIINSKTGKDITKIKGKIYDKYEPEILFDKNTKFVVKNIKGNTVYIEEQSKSPVKNPLVEEARKYKSAEEFADGVFGAEKGNTYKNVPKDLIDNEYLEYFDNKIYFKQKIDKGTVESWKERIKKGERPPIKIDDTNGRFELGDGYHRYQAYKELGFEKIPVFYKSELISLFNKIK